MLQSGITPKYVPVACEIIHKLPTLVAIFLYISILTFTCDFIITAA